MKDKWSRIQFRKVRTRTRLAKRPDGRPRLSVHRSLKYIYAQVIDDATGKTIVTATSLNKAIQASGKSAKNLAAARKVGEAVAEKALKAGVKKVAFDRGSYIFHGRIKAVAEGARAKGLEF